VSESAKKQLRQVMSQSRFFRNRGCKGLQCDTRHKMAAAAINCFFGDSPNKFLIKGQNLSTGLDLRSVSQTGRRNHLTGDYQFKAADERPGCVASSCCSALAHLSGQSLKSPDLDVTQVDNMVFSMLHSSVAGVFSLFEQYIRKAGKECGLENV
jgi:hypothetical protein